MNSQRLIRNFLLSEFSGRVRIRIRIRSQIAETTVRWVSEHILPSAPPRI